MTCEAGTLMLILLSLLCYFHVIIGIPKGCLITPRTKASGAPMPRWHFDSKGKRCKPIMWGGRGYNGNIFKTFDECEKTCGSLYRQDADVCLLVPPLSKCKRPGPSVVMWTYNSTTMTCVNVNYYGCNGNKNLHKTCKACRRKCIHHSTVLQFCPENPPRRKLALQGHHDSGVPQNKQKL
ncbi:BPTI/Kunitz domain-containing protein-like [Dermacentor variabilis]|uniref:BPTI/Kunitz domain-containing protein-like n=1 Tax=Dermacentor variabilis TaxID=34621 RepID=UPI003F5BD885